MTSIKWDISVVSSLAAIGAIFGYAVELVTPTSMTLAHPFDLPLMLLFGFGFFGGLLWYVITIPMRVRDGSN